LGVIVEEEFENSTQSLSVKKKLPLSSLYISFNPAFLPIAVKDTILDLPFAVRDSF
jgi:hypothetical protein